MARSAGASGLKLAQWPLFVEVAVREGFPLATIDAALLRAFPQVAVRPTAITPR